jgi:hypothetical protein
MHNFDREPFLEGGGVSNNTWFKLTEVSETTRSHLVPRLRVGGAIPLLPLYVFMASTGKPLPLPLAYFESRGK